MSLSIIIPAYNSATTLRKLLISLQDTRPDQTEVIVVDDASTDDTRAVVAAFSWVRPLFLETNGGPAHARNQGVANARHNTILFLDADVIVDPDTLRNTLTFFQQHPECHLMTGIYSSKPANNGLLPRYKALQCLSYYADRPPICETSVFWTGVAAIRRDTFLKLGGFDARRYRSAGLEDVELGRRAIAAGFTIYLNQNVMVRHHFPVSLMKNFRDHYRRGVMWAQLYFRTGKFDDYVTTRVQAISRLCAFGSMLALVLACVQPLSIWAGLVLFIAYIAGNLRLLTIFYRHALRELPLLGAIDYILALGLGLASLRAVVWRGQHILKNVTIQVWPRNHT